MEMTVKPGFGMSIGTALARPRAHATSTWPVTSAARVSSNQYRDLVRCTVHNSMITSDVVVPVPAGRDGLGAATQAAPPRGVPR